MCDFNSDTAPMHIFVKGFWDAHTIAAKIYEKDSQTLLEVIKLVEKLNTAQQVTATLIPPTVNMMPNDDICFVCGKTGHIGHHCPDAQCYNCHDFGHFSKDCPEKVLPSGTPHYHDRSHSQSHYDHNHRDRSQSPHYRHSQRRCFHGSGSHHWSHHGRSSNKYQRHTSHSPSCYCSSLQ